MASCPYGIGFDVHGKVVALWCGKWSCERCRVTNAKLWAWRASLHINSADCPAYFWTLTLRSSIHTPYQGFKALPTLWDNLRKTMQRNVGRWSYLAFIECHPKRSKIPHFHVLSMSRSPVLGKHVQNPIKDLAWQSGFGYIASEEVVEGPKGAFYVAKYASKHDPTIPRNFRRCRCSRDWAKLPEIELNPYLVKSRDEHLSDFLLRVADISGVAPEVLHIRWQDGLDEYQVDPKG